MMPGGPARAWSRLNAGRVLLLARREDGACLLELLGADDRPWLSAIDRMLRRLHPSVYQVG